MREIQYEQRDAENAVINDYGLSQKSEGVKK
jgi:hypothetical protein